MAFKSLRSHPGPHVRHMAFGMTVCTGAPRLRGGTTVGSVFLTDEFDPGSPTDIAKLEHEAKHAVQWAILGREGFAAAYLVAEGEAQLVYRWNRFFGGMSDDHYSSSGCENVFELLAGQAKGGYTCGG